MSWRCCARPRKGEARRAGQHLLKPLRQVVESVNWTFKGQLGLERHGGRTPEGIIARVLAAPGGRGLGAASGRSGGLGAKLPAGPSTMEGS